MAEYLHRKDALPAAYVDQLERMLFASPLVADSPLAGTFEGSRGFAIAFTERGLGELRMRFPVLTRYLEMALDERLHQKLLTLRARFRGAAPARPNAFYLNLLLLGPGNFVGRHVDATLRDISGAPTALPDRVSVAYLRVPSATGGELYLYRHRARVGRIHPRRGDLVLFRGDLAHEVRAFVSPDAAAQRASLVLEQYALDADELTRMPPWKICSKAGFQAYLSVPRSR